MAAATATRPTAEEILDTVSRMESTELELFADRVQALRNLRQRNGASPETALLEVILEPRNRELDARLRRLRRKQENGPLTTAEHRELLKLIEDEEWDRVRRVRALLGLAEMRGQSVEQIKDELGLSWGEIK